MLYFKKYFLVFFLLIFSANFVFSKNLTISAASSLTETFQDLVKIYEKQYKTDKVFLNFSSSGKLLQQIGNGAPVDVFASADEKTMDKAKNKNLINNDSRFSFAKNTLVIIVPVYSKNKINSLNELSNNKFKRIAVGNVDTVPVGDYTKTALVKEELWNKLQNKIIYAQNVRQVLDYVARGEVDIGFVYKTDAKMMPNKVKIIYTVNLDKPISYSIASIKNGNYKEANQFLKFLKSNAAKRVLEKYGFEQMPIKNYEYNH